MNIYNNTNKYLINLKYWTQSEESYFSNTSDKKTDVSANGYIDTDIAATSDLAKAVDNCIKMLVNKPEIEKVIFNKPATIIIWKDKTKTIVKCGDNDIYDPEKGLAMCYVKKILGNKGNYYNTIKKWLPKEE